MNYTHPIRIALTWLLAVLVGAALLTSLRYIGRAQAAATFDMETN